MHNTSKRDHAREMDRRIDNCLRSNAYAIIKNPHVDGDSHSTYTVGMTQFGLPELMATGLLHPNAMEAMLNGILNQWAQVGPEERANIKTDGIIEGVISLEDGSQARAKLVELDVRDLGKFRPQELRKRYANLGKPYRILQVLWPDKAGALPDEEGYDAEILQPLLPKKV